MATKKPAEKILNPNYQGNLVAQSRQTALDAIKAAQQPLIDQQTRAADQTTARGKDIQGFSQAVSELLKGVAPAVQQTYGQEADRQATYAKGYSDTMQKLLGQSADQINSTLQKGGAPAGQMIDPGKAQAAGDVLYGFGGSLPSKALSSAGAAFSGAAGFLPATALLRGAADVAANATAGEKTQQDIGDQLAQIAAKAPELEREIQNDTVDQAYKQHSVDLQDAKFTLQQQVDAFNQKYKVASLDMRGQSLKLQAQKFARQTLQADRSYGIALAGLGLRKASSQRAALAAEYKYRNGGFSSTQIAKYNGLLQQGLDTLPKDTTYGQYIARSVEHGVPLSLAIGRANTHWTDPLQRGTADSLSKLLGVSGADITGAAGLPTARDYNTLTGVGGVKPTTNVILAAQSFLGVPYKWGGNDPKRALDCSSFIQQTFKRLGINIPRTTYAQVKAGQPVTLEQLQPGDAVFTRPGKNGPNHVGLYIGNGQIQESPHTGDVNKIIPLKDFLSGGFVAARRYLGNG